MHKELKVSAVVLHYVGRHALSSYQNAVGCTTQFMGLVVRLGLLL